MTRRLGLLAALALSAGCTNRIRGEIEDQQIKVKSAFFFAQPAAFGTDSVIGVILTDLPKGCEDYGFYLANSANAVAPADQAATWAAVFPPDFWDITFLLRVGDPNIAVSAQAFAGVPWNEPLDAVGKAQGYFTHNLALRDAAYYDGTGNLDAYRKDYVSNGGTLEVKEHVPGDSIKGRFATFTVDPDTGAPTGLLEIDFSASFCAEADMLDSVFVGADG